MSSRKQRGIQRPSVAEKTKSYHLSSCNSYFCMTTDNFIHIMARASFKKDFKEDFKKQLNTFAGNAPKHSKQHGI